MNRPAASSHRLPVRVVESWLGLRNPDFYLFANVPSGPGRRSEKLMRKTWMDQVSNQQDNGASAELVRAVGPFLVLLTILGTLIWLIRILLENRRWTRIFTMQTKRPRKIDRPLQ